MNGEQFPAHERVGSAELDVALDAAKQRWVVVFEQVRRNDHHAIEAVQFLHQAVAVLVDAGRSFRDPGQLPRLRRLRRRGLR